MDLATGLQGYTIIQPVHIKLCQFQLTKLEQQVYSLASYKIS